MTVSAQGRRVLSWTRVPCTALTTGSDRPQKEERARAARAAAMVGDSTDMLQVVLSTGPATEKYSLHPHNVYTCYTIKPGLSSDKV